MIETSQRPAVDAQAEAIAAVSIELSEAYNSLWEVHVESRIIEGDFSTPYIFDGFDGFPGFWIFAARCGMKFHEAELTRARESFEFVDAVLAFADKVAVEIIEAGSPPSDARVLELAHESIAQESC